MNWHERYMTRFYDRRRGFVDGTTEFHQLCATALPRGGRILEVGAGPSNPTSRFLATLGELHGVDPDPAVRTNESLASASVLEASHFPFQGEHFDGCVSNYVLEHVQDPVTHLAEISRVLVPGGVYVFRTSNRFHYVGAVAQATPHWFHEAVSNRLRGLPTGADDPYPTHFAMNSRGAVVRLAREAGLSVETLRMVEKEPSYGTISPVLFLALTAYERAVNASERLAPLRANIFAVLKKGTRGATSL